MGFKQEEILAFEICCKYLNLNRTDFLDIERTEEPDIQTINDDIGIEVTQVIQPEDGELEYFFDQIRGLSEKEVFIKASKNKRLRKCIDEGYVIPNDIANGVVFHTNDNETPIIEAISKKLKKKKQSYRVFKKNILFLIITFQFIDEISIERFLIDKIKNEELNILTKFENYILFDKWNKELYIINEEYSIEHIKIA